MTEVEKLSKLAADLNRASAIAIEMVDYAHRSAGNGAPDRALQYSQSALNIAQAVALLKNARGLTADE